MVTEEAEECREEHRVSYFDDLYERHDDDDDDGVYVARGIRTCTAFPMLHLHSLKLRYTRNSRDVDTWQYALDEKHEWKVYGTKQK